MKAVAEHQEVATEQAAVKPSRTWRIGTGPASSCRATRGAKGTDPRRVWIPEEVGWRLQEGMLSCSSGRVQEKHLQENSDPGELWTAEGIGRSRREDDPLCSRDTAQGKGLQGRSHEGPSVEQGWRKNQARNKFARGTQKGQTRGWRQLMHQEGTDLTRKRDFEEKLPLGSDRTTKGATGRPSGWKSWSKQ
jgi:hypothetical protein